MNWKIRVLMFIKPEVLLKLFLKDLKFFTFISNNIFKSYFFTSNLNIEYDNIYLQFINLYPQIRFLQTNHIPEKYEVVRVSDRTYPSNRYILNGKESSHFIYSNYILPHPSNSSIPFTIGIIKEDKFKILTSNIFYFEVKIDSIKFRTFGNNESLLIGFSNAEKSLNKVAFGIENSFGLNVCESRLEIDSQIIFLPNNIKRGDTFGLGLKYLDKYKYKIFVTLNGENLNIPFSYGQDIILTQNKLKVIVNLNLPYGIDINFGAKKFLFNIEDYLNSSIVINSTKNNFMNNGYNLNKIDSNYIYQNSFYSEYIHNLLNTQIIPATF